MSNEEESVEEMRAEIHRLLEDVTVDESFYQSETQKSIALPLLDTTELERELEEVKAEQEAIRVQLHLQQEQNKIAENCVVECQERNARLDEEIQDLEDKIEKHTEELDYLAQQTEIGLQELEEFDEREAKRKNAIRIAFFQYATITGVHWEEPLDNGPKGYVCLKTLSSFDYGRYENDPVKLADKLWAKIESCCT